MHIHACARTHMHKHTPTPYAVLMRARARTHTHTHVYLPFVDIVPPAASTRALSLGTLGLWSILRGMPFLKRTKMVRESPMLAHTSLCTFTCVCVCVSECIVSIYSLMCICTYEKICVYAYDDACAHVGEAFSKGRKEATACKRTCCEPT